MKLVWKTSKTLVVGKWKIPCAENLRDQPNQVSGIRRDSRPMLLLKSMLWPMVNMRNRLLVDGFIESTIGKWMEEFVDEGTTFLEIGCGDMELRRFLPKTVCYNGLDLSFSEFQVRRVLRKDSNVNIVLASATSIPLESNSVSLLVATECFEHIPEIDTAIDEIYRVAKPGAKLLCSIPNNYCYKYQKKGPHTGHVNVWSYHEFKEFMESHKFLFVKGHMKGFWIPLPRRLTRTSDQLPISSKK